MIVPVSDPANHALIKAHDGRCGGQRHQMAKLHDDLAAYMWRVQGLAALGIVSAHYARGGDARAFAKGLSLQMDVCEAKPVHVAGVLSWHSNASNIAFPCRRASRAWCSEALNPAAAASLLYKQSAMKELPPTSFRF